MSEVFLLYLFTRLDAISGFLTIGCFFSFVIGFTAALMHAVEFEISPRLFKWMGVACVVFGLAAVFVPTQKDMAIIVGGKFAIDAARSPEGKQVRGLVYDAIMKQLRESAK